MKILITGPQGSGKTTQAEIISSRLGLCMVKAGSMAREMASQDTELSRKVREALEKGELIDDNVMADLIRTRLNEPICETGYVVDGYPRSMSQLQLFDPGYDLVILLWIPDDLAIDRLTKRGRSDDVPDAISERLKIYHQETEEVIEHFKASGIVRNVDATVSIEQTTKAIMEIIKEFYGYAE